MSPRKCRRTRPIPTGRPPWPGRRPNTICRRCRGGRPSRRKPKIVLANGAEGEPASRKDRVLLREVPHLVLDGAAVAARAVGAGEALIALRQATEAETALRSAQEMTTTQGARPLLWRICVTLGNLYQTQSREAEAEQAFSTAHTIIEY